MFYFGKDHSSKKLKSIVQFIETKVDHFYLYDDVNLLKLHWYFSDISQNLTNYTLKYTLSNGKWWKQCKCDISKHYIASDELKKGKNGLSSLYQPKNNCNSCKIADHISEIEKLYEKEQEIIQKNKLVYEEYMEKPAYSYETCKKMIKMQMIYPSEVDFGWDVEFIPNDGYTKQLIRIGFKAKNLYGIKLPYSADCTVDIKTDSVLDLEISQKID